MTANSNPASPATTVGTSAAERRSLRSQSPHGRRVNRAAALAAVNGATFIFFGIAALLYAAAAVFWAEYSYSSLIVGIGLVWVGYNEWRGRRMLQREEPRAARFLGRNQLALMTVIVLYAAWCIFYGTTHQDESLKQLSAIPTLQEMEDLDVMSIKTIYQIVVFGTYGTLIVLTVVFQGLNSLFYFRRGKDIEACRELGTEKTTAAR